MNVQAQEAQLSGFESPKVLPNTSFAFAIVALILAVTEAIKYRFGYLNLQELLASPTHTEFPEFVAERFSQ